MRKRSLIWSMDYVLLAAICFLIAVILIFMVIPARAQHQNTIYGPDGRVVAREATDSQGTTTVYGADGRVQARITAPKGPNRTYPHKGR